MKDCPVEDVPDEIANSMTSNHLVRTDLQSLLLQLWLLSTQIKAQPVLLGSMTVLGLMLNKLIRDSPVSRSTEIASAASLAVLSDNN